MKQLFISLFLFACLPLAAEFTQIESTSRITAVTVYPQQAKITRTVSTTLPAGQSLLVLKDLPAGLDTHSLRVSGTGDHPFTLGTVSHQKNTPTQAKPDQYSSLLQKIEDTEEAIRAEKDVISTARLQNRYIEQLAGTPPLLDKAQTTEHIIAISDFILTTSTQTATRKRDAERKMRALTEKLQGYMREREKMNNPQAPFSEIHIAAEAESSTDAIFEISYTMHAASWGPLYDMLITSDVTLPKIALKQYANVQQKTGEDWTDVTLTLSTARPTQYHALPLLQPQEIQIGLNKQEKNNRLSKMSGRDEGLELWGTNIYSSEDIEYQKKDRKEKARQPVMDTINSRYNTEYMPQGTQHIPSGTSTQKLLIGMPLMQGKEVLKSVPMQDAQIHRHITVTNTNNTPLLKGKAALYLDGNFTGNTMLAFLAPNAEYDLPIGYDRSISITRDVVEKEIGEKGILSKRKTDEKHYRISLTNNHDTTRTVQVIDRLPVSNNEDITVKLLSQDYAPDHMDLDHKRGIVAWDIVLKAGETRTFPFAYRISWPEDQHITHYPL